MSLTEMLLIAVIVLVILVIGLLGFFYFRWRGEYRDVRYLLRHFGPYERYEAYGRRVYDSPLFSIVDDAERRHDVELSWAARQMIVLPVAEQLEEGRLVEWRDVERSINKIIATMREESTESDRSLDGRRNAVAVIKAFFKGFCDIPPFCSRTGEAPPRREA